MSLISSFTKQTAILERRTGADGFGGSNYSAPETIRVRKERRQTWVQDQDGIQRKSTTYVLTEESIHPGDLIDGETVAAVEDVIPASGELIGTEAYL